MSHDKVLYKLTDNLLYYASCYKKWSLVAIQWLIAHECMKTINQHEIYIHQKSTFIFGITQSKINQF